VDLAVTIAQAIAETNKPENTARLLADFNAFPE
jgi:hypothetical protein